jgi:uncharacterized glyoxalase superfamily protein PhnB
MLAPILACADVDTAIAYYTDTLGFTLQWSMPDAAGKSEFASVQLADSEILLGVVEGFVESEDMAKRGIGVQLYITLPADFDIDELYQHAVAYNAIITRPLEDRAWGVRSFNVSDGDGYRLMIGKPLRPAP